MNILQILDRHWSLAEKIPAVNCSHMSYLKGDFKDSFSLFHTDPLEVESVAKNLSNKTSYGYDDIPVDVAKMSVHCIAPVLCRIINQSFSSRIYPSALKIARVCPVFKSGDRAKVNNYRTISILPSFSKIY